MQPNRTLHNALGNGSPSASHDGLGAEAPLGVPQTPVLHGSEGEKGEQDERTSSIQLFATMNRVRAKRDECGELLIRGKHGIVFDCDDGEGLALALFDNPPNRASKARTLLCLRKKALAAGLPARQIGDCESVFLFNPQDQEQSKLALKLVGVQRRRRLSEQHRQRLRAASQNTQYGATTAVL